jgi:hypothetical protein
MHDVRIRASCADDADIIVHESARPLEGKALEKAVRSRFHILFPILSNSSHSPPFSNPGFGTSSEARNGLDRSQAHKQEFLLLYS